MASPLFVVENLLSAGPTGQFPLHTLVGDEEAAGNEAWHVADGRRAPTDYWTGITPNAQRTLTATFDRIRAFTYVGLDRGHNLGTVQVFIEVTQDNAAWQLVASPVIPPIATPGPITNANGITTEEGAWGLYLGPANPPSGIGVRVRIPALGAGLLPVIVGAWVGMAYDPGFFLKPWGEDQDDFPVQTVVTEWGWRGRGPAPTPNVGQIGLRLDTEDAYDVARYHLQGHWASGRPMWCLYDQAQADRLFLALRPEQTHFGLNIEPSWSRRSVVFPYVEHEPVRA